MEILMPLVMAKIIDNGIGNGDIHYVAKMGLLMIGTVSYTHLAQN